MREACRVHWFLVLCKTLYLKDYKQISIYKSAQGGALLTLTRKLGESIRIGDDIVVIVKEIKGKQVRIGIEAPRDVYVCREELFQKIEEANRSAMSSSTDSISSDDSLAALGNLLLSKQRPQVTTSSSKKAIGDQADEN